MKKLTKALIEQMAKEIMDFLVANELSYDVCIYYNNKKMKNDYQWNGDKFVNNVVVLDGYNPHDYFDYAAHDHILSMSFEGALYDSMNYSGHKVDKLEAIFSKYGVYYELGNAWNLTVYPINDDMEVEYTLYDKPKEKIELYRSSQDIPYELREIMDKWHWWSMLEGDKGSCVIGAGFNFEWNGDEYFMCAQSPYQGSLSWEANIDKVRALLENIGATNIKYNWGVMD